MQGAEFGLGIISEVGEQFKHHVDFIGLGIERHDQQCKDGETLHDIILNNKNGSLSYQISKIG